MSVSTPPFSNYKSPAVSTGTGYSVSSHAALWHEEIDSEDTPQEKTVDGPDGNKYTIISRYPDLEEEVIQEGTTEYILNSLGQKKWSSKPQFDNQYSVPHMVRRDPVTSLVLNLSNPEDLKQFNNLQARCIPGGPSVEMQPITLNFHNGEFFAFVSYNKVWYLNPIK